jgi:preprotein translocase subunit Sec63
MINLTEHSLKILYENIPNTVDSIKKRYKELSRVFHPDKTKEYQSIDYKGFIN